MHCGIGASFAICAVRLASVALDAAIGFSHGSLASMRRLTGIIVRRCVSLLPFTIAKLADLWRVCAEIDEEIVPAHILEFEDIL